MRAAAAAMLLPLGLANASVVVVSGTSAGGAAQHRSREGKSGGGAVAAALIERRNEAFAALLKTGIAADADALDPLAAAAAAADAGGHVGQGRRNIRCCWRCVCRRCCL